MAQATPNLPYVAMAGVIILGIVSFFALYVPQYDRITVMREEALQLQDETATQQQLLQSIERKLAELATQAGHERELALLLPNSSDVDDALRVIDRAGFATGVVIAAVSNNGDGLLAAERAARVRGQATLPDKISPLGLNVSATGSYQQLRQFADTLSSSIRLIDIQQAKFTTSAGQTADILGGQFELRFYRYDNEG